jgi:manganese efflux pump family protein
MIGLGLSISLDELAIGFTLGLARLPVVWVIVAIGVQALMLPTRAGSQRPGR